MRVPIGLIRVIDGDDLAWGLVGVEHVQDLVELAFALEAFVLEEHDLVNDAVQIVNTLVFLFLVIDFPVLGALEFFFKLLVQVAG